MEDWAEIRRLHRAEGMPIKAIARRLGVGRNTVRRALAAESPPKYQRVTRGSVVDAVEPQIRELLEAWPSMPATVIAERIGYAGRGGLSGVERFMKGYFLAAKDVGDLTAIVCAELEARHAKHRPVLDRFLGRLRRRRGRALEGREPRYAYFTSGALPHPWGTVPQYLAGELAALGGCA